MDFSIVQDGLQLTEYSNIPFTLLGIFTVCYSILLIAYVFIHWANQHTKEIQILKSLGTDNKMLVKDFTSLLFKSICLPLCVYLIICIVLSINIWVSLISLMVYLFSLSMIVLICYILYFFCVNQCKFLFKSKNNHKENN